MTINEPKITKFEANINKIIPENVDLHLNIYGNISISKDPVNNSCLSSETLELYEDKNRLLLIEMSCPVILDKELNDSIEEKNEKIRKETVSILYQEISSIITNIFQKFPNKLPPLPSSIEM